MGIKVQSLGLGAGIGPAPGIGSLTDGSILFAASGGISQNNGQLNWNNDPTRLILSIGVSGTTGLLSSAVKVRIESNSSNDSEQLMISNQAAAGGAGIILNRTSTARAAMVSAFTSGVRAWNWGILRDSGGVITAWSLGTGSDIAVTAPALMVETSGLIVLGYHSNAFPALKRSGTIIQIRNGDDTGYATIDCLGLRASNVAGFNGTVTPVNTITVTNGIVTNVA